MRAGWVLSLVVLAEVVTLGEAPFHATGLHHFSTGSSSVHQWFSSAISFDLFVTSDIDIVGKQCGRQLRGELEKERFDSFVAAIDSQFTIYIYVCVCMFIYISICIPGFIYT